MPDTCKGCEYHEEHMVFGAECHTCYADPQPVLRGRVTTPPWHRPPRACGRKKTK